MAKRTRADFETAGGHHSANEKALTKRPRAGNPSKPEDNALQGFESLPEFPLDVWYEIFGHLSPLDLVHLARINKGFRAVILNRSANSCWRRALAALDGLPQCPQDLSAPAYAHLMFSQSCHNCGKDHCDYMYWDCRARYCEECSTSIPLKTMRWNELKKLLYAADLRISRTQLGTFMPVMTVSPVEANWHKPGFCRNRTADVEEFVNTWLESDQSSRQNFIAHRQQRMIEHRQNPYVWYQWREAQKAQAEAAEKAEKEAEERKKMEIERIRMEDITERLKMLGFADVYAKMNVEQRHRFNSVRGVVCAQPLTEHAWNTLRPVLLKAMTDVRRAQEWRAYLNRLAVLDEMLLTVGVIHPRYPDIGTIDNAVPEVRELITSRLDEELSATDYDVLRPILWEFITRQHQEVESTLSGLVKRVMGVEELSVEDPLSLAVAYFQCQNFESFQAHYPECVVHHCVNVDVDLNYGMAWHERTILEGWRDNNFSSSDLYEGLIKCRYNDYCRPWCAKFTEESIVWARQVIEACGQDPLKVTCAEMDALDMHLMCRCAPNICCIMKWRGALEHRMRCGRYCNTPTPRAKWEIVPTTTVELVRALEESVLEKFRNKRSAYYMWGCRRCLGCRLRTKAAVRAHLHQIHGITNIAEGDLYTLPMCQWDFWYPTVYVFSEDAKRCHDRHVRRALLQGSARYRHLS